MTLNRRIILYPYKIGSESCRLLQQELRSRGRRVLRVRQNGSYRPRSSDLIINWGCSSDNNMYPNWEAGPLLGEESLYMESGLNMYGPVGRARNKLYTFQTLKEYSVRIPDFTTDRNEALEFWDDASLVGRKSLTGSQGLDILFFDIDKRHEYDDENLDEALNSCKLFTKYIKKKAEYRVHVFNGQVIDVQQKRKKAGFEGERDTRIRNLHNGYVFCRDNVNPNEDVALQAVKAVQALGLHFGAVDVIWNEHRNQAFVLEVNTAPGLEGTTVIKYADAIEGVLQQ